MVTKTIQHEVTIPGSVFESMVKAYKGLESFASEFEDFLLSQDTKFIKKIRKARDEHLRGKVQDITLLKL